MIKKAYIVFKWIIFLAVMWFGYLFISILHFPVGKADDSADAAIVLGAAVYDSKPSPVFEERINHAINLYHAKNVNKLIFTGGTKDESTPTESRVALEYAISKGVKANDIFIEEKSLTTRENFIYSLPILNKENLLSALIISDSLHLKRAMLMAKSLNINAKPSATPTSRYKSLKTKLPFALRELYFYHHYLLFAE